MASQSDVAFKICSSCEPIDFAEAQRTLFITRHSRVILVNDQAWLGRCIVVPKRHVSSFDQLQPMEIQDLHECRVKISRVFDSLFGITHDWIQSSNPTGDHADSNIISMHHIKCEFSPFQRQGNVAGIKFSVVRDKFQSQLINLKNDLQAELISQRLISEENMKGTNPSRGILELCAKYRESHFFDECTTPALITTATIILELVNRMSRL